MPFPEGGFGSAGPLDVTSSAMGETNAGCARDFMFTVVLRERS
jgi:hypothetical protein